MIPRVLIPQDVRLAPESKGAPAPRRLSTVLDERALVPAGLPVVPLDGRTSIPAHFPLDVLATRIVVPRDMPAKPLETTTVIPQLLPLTVLDKRLAVPRDLLPVVIEPKGPVAAADLPEVLEPDVITTGQVNFLVKPVEERVSHWQGVARVSSIVFSGLIETPAKNSFGYERARAKTYSLLTRKSVLSRSSLPFES